MKSIGFRRTVLIAIAGGILAAAASAQIPVPVPPLPGLDIRITTGHPPAVRHEHRSARPGPDYVWVAGFWNDNGGRWEWVPGRWDRPEVSARWVSPRYIRSEGGYIYEPGHWSNQTLIVGDEVRQHRAWKHYHHDEDNNNHNHDREHDRDHDRDH